MSLLGNVLVNGKNVKIGGKISTTKIIDYDNYQLM